MSFLWIATGSFMSPRKFEPVLTSEKSLGRGACNNQRKVWGGHFYVKENIDEVLMVFTL